MDVYSSCDKVELFLNGKSLGFQPTTREKKFLATFSVPYETGVLQAVGYVDYQRVAEYTLETTGAPAAQTGRR